MIYMKSQNPWPFINTPKSDDAVLFIVPSTQISNNIMLTTGLEDMQASTVAALVESMEEGGASFDKYFQVRNDQERQS